MDVKKKGVESLTHVCEGRNANFLLDATAFRVSVGENGSVFDSAGAEKEVNRISNVGKC